jgi:DNA-damage-inducible protein D
MHVEGGEHWFARDMQPFLAYTKWQNMEQVVAKAKTSCKNNGHNVEDHFTSISKNSYEGGRPASDIRLTRYACYLVAMNGDPDKPEVAAAQHYFAMSTRENEVRKDHASRLREASGRTSRRPRLHRARLVPIAGARDDLPRDRSIPGGEGTS